MFIKRDCENPKRIYVWFFGRRLVFEGFKYVGWYKP